MFNIKSLKILLFFAALNRCTIFTGLLVILAQILLTHNNKSSCRYREDFQWMVKCFHTHMQTHLLSRACRSLYTHTPDP